MPPPQDPFSTPRPPADGPAPGYAPPPTWGPPPSAAAPVYGAPPATASPQGWGPTGYGGPPETSSKAVIALVCAVGSFMLFPVVPAIVALVLAPQARREIAASGGRMTGEGLVTAAKVVAWVNLVLSALVVLGFVLLFAGLASIGSELGTGLETEL